MRKLIVVMSIATLFVVSCTPKTATAPVSTTDTTVVVDSVKTVIDTTSVVK